jgi:hypothetical protein
MNGWRRTRRDLLTVGPAVAANGVALASQALALPPVPRLDLRDPRVALQTYVRLRGSTADSTVFQSYSGDIFLIADGQVGIPLCGFVGIQKSIWRGDDRGGFTNSDYDLGFYVDYESRAILDRWRNPVTGDTVQVYHYRGGPSGARFAPDGPNTDVYGGVAGRWSLVGDQIWHTTASWGERPNPLTPEEWPKASSGKTVLGSMSLTFGGRLSDLTGPARHTPRSFQIWTNVTAWMPWMEMGQRSGFNFWRWVGAKGVARKELAPELVAAAEKVWPGFVERDAVWKQPTSGRLDYIRAKRGLEPTR